MNDINKVLKNANIYSVEYCGYYIFKLSVSNDLNIDPIFQDVTLEFVSGCSIVNPERNINCQQNVLIDLYGKNVIKAELKKENQLEIELDNDCKIISIKDDNVLVDINWIFRTTLDKNNYVLCDGIDLYFSNNMKILLE